MGYNPLMRIGPMDPDLFRRLDVLASTCRVHLARDAARWCVTIARKDEKGSEVVDDKLTDAVAEAVTAAHERGWCDLSQPLPIPAPRRSYPSL